MGMCTFYYVHTYFDYEKKSTFIAAAAMCAAKIQVWDLVETYFMVVDFAQKLFQSVPFKCE